MSFLAHTHVNRTRDFSGTLTEDDDSTEVQLAAEDVVHFKIGGADDSPLVEFSSADPSSNGSTISFTAGSGGYTARLHGKDMRALGPGIFDVEIGIWDDSEGAYKIAEQGCLHVARTMGGNLDAEESSSSNSSSSSGGSSPSSG